MFKVLGESERTFGKYKNPAPRCSALRLTVDSSVDGLKSSSHMYSLFTKLCGCTCAIQMAELSLSFSQSSVAYFSETFTQWSYGNALVQQSYTDFNSIELTLRQIVQGLFQHRVGRLKTEGKLCKAQIQKLVANKAYLLGLILRYWIAAVFLAFSLSPESQKIIPLTGADVIQIAMLLHASS